MAAIKKTQWVILFVTFILSCVSVALFAVSFATTQWIKSEATIVNGIRNSEISYGLFTGNLDRFGLSSGFSFDLTMTCLYDEGKCAYSCKSSKSDRESDLRKILNGEVLVDCGSVGGAFSSNKQSETNITLGSRATDNIRDEFIGLGFWLSTVIFLSISILFAVISAVFSIINVAFNPIQQIFNVFGLYIWNGVAIGSCLLTMILYGSLFGSSLSTNIGITDTLQSVITYSSDGLASLGFSFWILIVPIVLHSINIGLIVYRQYLIVKDPPITVIPVKKHDTTILLF